MNKQSLSPLLDFFKDLKDPHIEQNKVCPLIEVIVITLLAVMAFAEGWEDIEKYGKAKEAWLKKFLPLEHGVPKHDVYRRVFTRLKSETVASCFMAWVRAVNKPPPKVVACGEAPKRGHLVVRGLCPAARRLPDTLRTPYLFLIHPDRRHTVAAAPEVVSPVRLGSQTFCVLENGYRRFPL